MVVRNLENYMIENGLTFRSNLKTIILEKLSSSSEEDSTVIIDFSSLLTIFPENDVSVLCYGQPKIVKEKIQKLASSITSLGVNLIAVFRGNSPRKLKYWVPRQVKKKNQEEIFLQRLEKGEILNESILDEHTIVYTEDCVMNTLKSNDCVKVFRSLKSTHEDVAEYARKSKCLAVLGQDSNYNIYNEIPVYISAKCFDIDTLDCVVFDKVKLLQDLKLSSNQLPLFATLVGNEVIETHHPKYSDIANFIRCHVDPYQFVSANIRIIQKKFLSGKVNQALLRKSLDMYLKKDRKSEEKLDFLEDKKTSCDISSLLYNLIKTKEIRIPSGLENSKDIQSVPTWKLFLALRQKIYGVVFNDVIPVEEFIIDLRCKTNAFNYTNTSVFDGKPHPGMEKLWTDSSDTMNQIKWELFCKTVSQKITPDILQRVDPHFRIFITSLHYLAYVIPETTAYKVFYEKYEVMAFVITAIIINQNLNTENYTVNIPDYRALLLTSTLYECYNLIMLLNQSCGLIATNEESCWCHFFDGVVFQSIYGKLKKGGNERKFLEDSFLEKIEPLLNVIYCEL